MYRFLTSILLLFSTTAHAQYNDTTYLAPMPEVGKLHAGNFGEIRAGHFHAGIDLKTNNTTGYHCVAVADGYISRVTVSTWGYGQALYITLADGHTAVYGHLERFCDPIEEAVRAERYQKQSNHVDLHFGPTTYPVKRGQTVAFSGNSGTSFGPHLHYELRHTATQRYVNLVKEGIFTPDDQQPPRFRTLHYVEIDSLQGVCITSPAASYAVVNCGPGRYRLTRSEPIPVGRKGYFIAEATDRRDNLSNTFGLWRLTGLIDTQPFFEYRMDGFTPTQSRFSDAVSCYSLQNDSRNEVIRMAHMASTPDQLYPVAVERGVIRTSPGERRQIQLQAEDDRGNCSTLEFEIEGHTESFQAPTPPPARVAHPETALSLGRFDHFAIDIPAGALFEPTFCRIEQVERPLCATPGVVILSPVYRCFDTLTPLQRNAKVAIRTPIPPKLRLRAAMARRTANGTLSSLGGHYQNGSVQVQTRVMGELVVVADTLPPTIKPLFADRDDLSKQPAIRFHASDNFSGVASCSIYIDKQWVPCDRLPMQGTLLHRFDRPAEQRHHPIRITVTDKCGNTSQWEGTFYR